MEPLMSLNTKFGFYVRKGSLNNISGEFHYKDLHPKVKKEKEKLWPKKTGMVCFGVW